MSNLNLQKLREWVWPWPWTFNALVRGDPLRILEKLYRSWK